MTAIEYHGKEYTLFEIEADGDYRCVAHECLESQLISNDGKYTDEEAKSVDEAIYFYVDDNITTDEEAQKYVDDNCF